MEAILENNELYKVFQINDILVNKYGYSQFFIKDFEHVKEKEAWLFNAENKKYQAIRVSFFNASQFEFDSQRINTYLNLFSKVYKKKKISFLDIHICNDKHVAEYEPYDYINIEENYYDGVDLSVLFPEIYNSIHKVKDSESEIKAISEKIIKTTKTKYSKIKNLNKRSFLVTYIVMALCIINYLISLYFKYKYDDASSAFILLGADYKTFTLGLKQFYRLITYAFVHNDILHLTCNLISFYSIGRYVESTYGHFKYFLILFFSILVGGLTQGILSDNGLCLGLSGGIYGLFVVFIFLLFKTKVIDLKAILPTIFINVGINFISTTAWMCHLGGAIGGLLMYFTFEDKNKLPGILMCILTILILFYKYATISSINSFYGGTDLNIVNILNDLGFKNISSDLLTKLINVYQKYGG